MISVIVPVYNVKPYLRKCLDSVINQTNRDIEILIIDDGSTDGSGEICDEYKSDNRVKVYHTENRGLSAARNLGLELASGEWIEFVDSDDWVEQNYCSVPLELAITHQADLVIFQFRINRRKRRILKIKPGIKTEEEAIRLIHDEASIVVWNKLFHRSLFQDIRFPDGKNFEDNMVTHRLIHEAARVYYTNLILYDKYNREGNITSQMTYEAAEMLCEMRLERYRDLENWGYHEEAEYVRQQAMWSYLKSVGRKGRHSEEYIVALRKIRRTSDYLNWRIRLMIGILKVSIVLFDAICILYGKRVQASEA